MSLPFPTLDSIRPSLPKAEPQTEWVSALAQVPVATKKATGWVPPTYEPVVDVQPTVDLEALKLEAKEEGFCAGYVAGQRAGTERGLAEGRMQGREEGRTEAKAEVFAAEQGALQEFAAALGSAAEEIGPAVQRWQEMVEARAAELAMDAVRALLGAELAIQRPDAMGVVREALGHADGALKATIRLAPFDRAALAERKEEILMACASLRDVELVDDRSIDFGCVIETEQGVVDATLATRLSLLEAA